MPVLTRSIIAIYVACACADKSGQYASRHKPIVELLMNLGVKAEIMLAARDRWRDTCLNQRTDID